MKGPTATAKAAATDNYGVHVENNFDALDEGGDPVEMLDTMEAKKEKDKVCYSLLTLLFRRLFRAFTSLT